MVRRIAASKVYTADGALYRNHVVELENSVLTAHYPLSEEQAMTEWHDGTIVVDETQHIQLQ